MSVNGLLIYLERRASLDFFPTGVIKNVRVLDTFHSRQMAKIKTKMPSITNYLQTTLFSCVLPSTMPVAASILFMPSIVLINQINRRNSGSTKTSAISSIAGEKEACWSLPALSTHMNGIAQSDFFSERYNNIFFSLDGWYFNTGRSRWSF